MKMTMRDVSAALKAAGLGESTVEKVKASLEPKPRVVSVPRAVQQRIGHMCSRDSRCVVTYNHAKKHWSVFTYEGMQRKVAAVMKTNARVNGKKS